MRKAVMVLGVDDINTVLCTEAAITDDTCLKMVFADRRIVVIADS